MNKNQIRKEKKHLTKKKSISYKGGACEICGNKNEHLLSFHHIKQEEKLYEVCQILDYSWETIKNELDKCLLVCHNCHMEIHEREDSKDVKGSTNKKVFLEYKGVSSCECCGYNKSNRALSFHHVISEDKEKNVKTNKRLKTVNDLPDDLKIEIDKCEVLCANCHYLKHNQT
jgi:hypothetical protein